jgi:hypothetical protein
MKKEWWLLLKNRCVRRVFVDNGSLRDLAPVPEKVSVGEENGYGITHSVVGCSVVTVPMTVAKPSKMIAILSDNSHSRLGLLRGGGLSRPDTLWIEKEIKSYMQCMQMTGSLRATQRLKLDSPMPYADYKSRATSLPRGTSDATFLLPYFPCDQATFQELLSIQGNPTVVSV